MRKIASLFRRDYEGSALAYDELVEGSEWVVAGEGLATIKFDGSCCMVRNGLLFKRYDRKLAAEWYQLKKQDSAFVPRMEHFKSPPEGWEAAEPAPNIHTGHWPGWLPVGDSPEDRWHREAFERFEGDDGTYELVGPKVRTNPHGLSEHFLWKHGQPLEPDFPDPPRSFEGLRDYLSRHVMEGVVWHHPDGRMVKIKRRDFGYPWPEP